MQGSNVCLVLLIIIDLVINFACRHYLISLLVLLLAQFTIIRVYFNGIFFLNLLILLLYLLEILCLLLTHILKQGFIYINIIAIDSLFLVDISLLAGGIIYRPLLCLINDWLKYFLYWLILEIIEIWLLIWMFKKYFTLLFVYLTECIKLGFIFINITEIDSLL